MYWTLFINCNDQLSLRRSLNQAGLHRIWSLVTGGLRALRGPRNHGENRRVERRHVE